MRCSACGAELPIGSKFCNSCGSAQATACARCGHGNPPGSRFCTECGGPLAGPAPEPRFASPSSYTPRHLAEKILTSKSALEGQRKHVTVLFADLKSSLELLADRDPEEARKLLDPVVERMIEAVHRYEGTVNLILGDGIMALFGAPLAHEDHAVRACYAALRMQESIKRYALEVQRTEGIAVHIRVGLNSGDVVVGSIASDLRMEYTAIGQTTHLAARMEQMAMPGSILVTADTLRLAEGYVQVKSLGPAQVKGLSEPIEIYELTGPGLTRTRLQAAAARGLTRFVGREGELETLRQLLGRAGDGHGQIVALVGEPGVGKSRLAWEFTHSHRTQGWLVLESGSVSYGRASPYLPVIDLLKSYCGIEARDDGRRIRERLTGKLLTLDESLRPTLPALLALLDVPVDPSASSGQAAWEALDPPERRRRTLEAIKRLLLRESQVQPLLLVFEDLHWIDSETQALLDSLVDSIPTARILLLVDYRPEYQHTWSNRTYYSQLRLASLSPANADELLQVLLGTDPDLQPLKHELIVRTEGNPFFLEESVRGLVETGALAGERGAYRLTRAVEATQVPTTVQAILAARIDRLPPDEKRLLQLAAVVGKDVPFALIEAIAELPEEDGLREGLARLQTAEFLYETSLFPDLEYTFKHALSHEVAYGSVLQERRRALHARIVEAIEALAGDRLADQVERLAHHAVRGQAWEKAVAHCRQAGAKAVARSANDEAVAYFEQALNALARLPERRDTLELAIDIRFDLRDALQPLGQFKRVFDYLREAEPIADNLADQHRLAWILSYMTFYFRVTGQHDQAIEHGRRTLALPATRGDVALQVETNLHMGPAYHALGDYRRAIEAFTNTLDALERNPLPELLGHAGLLSVMSRSYPVWSLAEVGRFGDALVLGDEALRIAEAADHPLSLATAYCVTGHVHLRRGDLEKAIAALERGLAVCQTRDVPAWLPGIFSHLGYAHTLSGRIAQGLDLLEQGMPISTRTTGGHPLWIGWLGEAHLLSGHRDEATEIAQRASELSRERKERGHEAWARRLDGEIAAHTDPPVVEQAERSYRQALALADELGMGPLQAHCHLALGALYRGAGRSEQATTELSAAIELFRSMDMQFWLGRAEAELAEATASLRARSPHSGPSEPLAS